MHISVEGLPALGKSEVLSVLRLYYPHQVEVLPELVKDVSEREGIDLFRQRDRLSEAIWASVPEREEAVRAAQAAGKIVIEESHLGVHAAYAAALGDRAFLAQFKEREANLVWPDAFFRFEAPLPVSLIRQAARGDPRYAVPGEVLETMLAWLDRWHVQRGSNLRSIGVDRPPAEAIGDIAAAAGLAYRPPSTDKVLPYVFLLGRPAAGKSELIQFLTQLPADERAEAYHLGTLRVADDFPLLWQLFVEDDLWEQVGRGRLHSRRVAENYAVADDSLWPFLILRLGQEILRSSARAGETVIVEFARGGPTGYRDALALLPPEILQKAGIVYLDVTFEESWRRNVARYDQARREGILTHSVPREEMERTYAAGDWASLAPAATGHVHAGGVRVPYITVPNVPEPISPDDFARRFHPALDRLWTLAQAR